MIMMFMNSRHIHAMHMIYQKKLTNDSDIFTKASDADSTLYKI